jgi:alpha-L-rhamnosidase
MGLPGQEYFAGTHFNPNVTWWNLSAAFVRYLNRVQFMSQRGRVVADALYYYGDHAPNVAGLKEADPARVLPGYDYDITNEEVLLTRLSVQAGRVELPHGNSYRLLVLPDHKVLSLDALKKVRELVRGGATVLGAKPERTVSLVGYPQCDAEFKRLADEVWGPATEQVGEHRFGQGRVVWGLTGREWFQKEGWLPDFEVSAAPPLASFDNIHRTIGDADYYFVSSQNRDPQGVDLAFRSSGRRPELWDPLTGRVRDAAAFTQKGGRTYLPLEFDPYGSIFVVFRKPISPQEQGTGARNSQVYETATTVNGPWDVRFDPKWGAPELVRFDELASWTARPEEGIRHYSGTAVYRTRFDYARAAETARLAIDLGDVRDVGVARVILNGEELGITWSPPFRLEIPGRLKPRDNDLQIEVANSWRNRLVGDRDLPEDRRYTRTNITIRKEWPLLDAGLLGPVRIVTVR